MNKSISQIIELGKRILEIVHRRCVAYYMYLVLVISTFFFFFFLTGFSSLIIF